MTVLECGFTHVFVPRDFCPQASQAREIRMSDYSINDLPWNGCRNISISLGETREG